MEVAGVPELRDELAELLQQLGHPANVVLVGVGGDHQRDRVLPAGLQGDHLRHLQRPQQLRELPDPRGVHHHHLPRPPRAGGQQDQLGVAVADVAEEVDQRLGAAADLAEEVLPRLELARRDLVGGAHLTGWAGRPSPRPAPAARQQLRPPPRWGLSVGGLGAAAAPGGLG